MSKKLIFAGVVVGIGGFIGGYLFGKKYKAKTYGEAYNDGQKDVIDDLKRIYNEGGDNLHYYVENYFGINE